MSAGTRRTARALLSLLLVAGCGGKPGDPSEPTTTYVPPTGTQAPEGQDGVLETPEDTPASGQLVADGGLSFAVVQAPTGGTVDLDPATGAFTFTPDPDRAGADLLVWRAYRGALDTGPRILSITVHPVQDAPVAVGAALSAGEDTSVGAALAGADADGDALVFAIATPPAHGAAALDADGALAWTPDADFSGTDALTFTVSDGVAVSAPATVTLTVAPAADAPTALPVTATGPEDALLAAQVTATDSDGDPLTYTLLAAPAHGTAAVVAGTGAVSYAPDPDFAGSDSLVVLVSDDRGASAVAPVAIEITPVNDAPVAVAGGVVTSVGVARAGTLAAVDADGDPLTFGLRDPPAHGFIGALAGAAFTYTPDPGFVGVDSFTFVASDGVVSSAPGVVTVTVTGHEQADSDGDGLQDLLEIALATDPFAVDTDGDTVPDGGELLVLLTDPRVDESGPCAPPWEFARIGAQAGPTAVFAADLDGDGDADVLASTLHGAKAVWYENRGGGAFGAASTLSAAATGGFSVAAADLDGDGDADALSASANDDRVSWYENLGAGKFGAEKVIDSAADYAAVVGTADLDGDGDPDVFAASYLDDTVGWYENLGGGAIGPRQVVTTTADGVDALVAADVDGDGDADLVSGSYAGDDVSWYANAGGGAFGAPQLLAVVPGAHALRAADLDGDGLPELLAIAYDTSEVLLLRNAGGVFAPAELVDGALVAPSTLDVVDLEGDGDVDLVVTDTGNDRLLWYENVAGDLGPPQQLATAATPWWVLAADLDGDRDPDLLTTSLGANEIGWYESQLEPADTDGDGLSDPAEDCISLTDPASSDSDGGGVGDGDELLVLTDPADPIDG